MYPGGESNASKEGQGRLEGRELLDGQDPQEEIQDEEGGAEQGGDFEEAIQEGEAYQEAVLMYRRRYGMRRTKVKRARVVRDVKAGLTEQVKLGIITPQQKRDTLLNIGARMRRSKR